MIWDIDTTTVIGDSILVEIIGELVWSGVISFRDYNSLVWSVVDHIELIED